MFNLEELGLTKEDLAQADLMISGAFDRKNVASFRDELSERRFMTLARFWLCIPKMVGYDVVYENHYRMSDAKAIFINFDRDEDAEEVAFPSLTFVHGNSTISVIEPDAFKNDYDNEKEPFKADIIDSGLDYFKDNIKIVKCVQEKDGCVFDLFGGLE